MIDPEGYLMWLQASWAGDQSPAARRAWRIAMWAAAVAGGILLLLALFTAVCAAGPADLWGSAFVGFAGVLAGVIGVTQARKN